ncbi:MAG: hypothetical protein A2842_02160 [Candidatus Wildermuthbacteria bacterium RIFCSPHIGHO2_01_FULL_48_25]|uniref:SHSP domain-containing protein n=1 Tax=Candidatus Wildermuthbacteria bacterium RIFCSPLOWO2_01_FULL_48_16 TaxID=1802461 RepID=A0A1G2RK01_9BACT|nr:MAG: hypothetical protein A2842_02160 [Candidatus Wildermuthbacteria bacterium RIFCSPHIGHO2_01_FULL_48_25]OHA69333.1 MAG: hypothetical protein A3J57_02010 [Candidatus Wildermuthbacteria bacterium RIFCSPHIGHO2_02_FULL_49_12b]OHA73183.1 MAG: hypothetical protein A3B24_00890 [Candidatus Wildermuthbacteria bacterium RIFCSPLOWO2_01_FULL_48_16]
MSFFDKLRNSIGVEETEEELVEEKETEEEEEEKPRKQVPQKTQKIQVKGAKKIHQEEDLPAEAPPAGRAGLAKEGKPHKAPAKKDEQESSWFEPEGELAVDVYQTNGEIVIQATIAGVNPDDLDIAIENDVVTISGERRNPNEEEDKSYFYQECYWGPFSRQIILPEEIDTTRIEASMKEGIFTLRLPKLERQKVKRIKVRG